MKDPVDISIVVLNWNTSDLLVGALDSIVSTVGDLRIEVTVIDNASTDGGLEHVKGAVRDDHRFSFIQRQKNIGWAATNIMIERARGKYILTLDSDARLLPNALQSLYAFMESNPKAGAATAKLLNPDGSVQLYYRRLMTPAIYFFTTIIGRVIDKYILGLRRWSWYRYDDLDTSRVSEVEQPSWPCLIWRREALGAYIADAEIPFYFVDVEMSKRLYNHGYKIYLVPDALATHFKSTSYGKAESTWKRREYERSLLFYFKRYYPLWFPVIWLEVQVDRLLRKVVTYVIGHEPLR